MLSIIIFTALCSVRDSSRSVRRILCIFTSSALFQHILHTYIILYYHKTGVVPFRKMTSSCGKGNAPCCAHRSTESSVVQGQSDDVTRTEETISRSVVDGETSDYDDDNHHLLDDDDDDPWIYRGKRLQALNFPIGGFGAGNILLQGDGSLQGWTVQNQFHNPEYTPLNKLPGNMFALSVSWDDPRSPGKKRHESFLLQSAENYTLKNQAVHHREERHVSQHQVDRLKTCGGGSGGGGGVTSIEMKCQYPIATVKYHLLPSDIPIDVQMETMTPLIPNNAQESSYPLGVFSFSITNKSQDMDGGPTVAVDLLQSTMNFVGWDGHTDCCHAAKTPFWGGNVNTPFVSHDNNNEIVDNGTAGGATKSTTTTAGLFMTSQTEMKDQTRQGSIALSAVVSGKDAAKVGVITLATTEKELYDKFNERNFEYPSKASPTPPSPKGTSYMGGIIQSISMPPNTTKTVVFVLAWYFPNRPCTAPRDNLPKDIWGNRYATWFKDAKDVACQFSSNARSLMDVTRSFVDTLYGSTIPWEVLESAAGRVACLRSPTMFWSKDGVVLGNEGNACCPLNCTHVYGYTTLIERLFPELAMDMRKSDFVTNFDKNNGVSMRFGEGGFALDGSLASVIKTFLVVQQADPTAEFLKSVWPNVKQQMGLVFKCIDKGGVIRSSQQNTYDSSMQGCNTFIGSYLVTALKAASKMAALLGDVNFMKKCSKQSEISAAQYEATCWHEDFSYYIADVDEGNCENSYSTGCFIDQLCATSLSLACGLGPVFDPNHEAKARRCILRNNFVCNPPFRDQQHHLYNGDSGIRVCTYPNGKFGKGMPYSNLVSSGFTYPVVAGMIHDGSWDDALKICGMIRARQSGLHRSPWNEPECGLNYARSMSAWNLFDQACGFTYDCTQGSIGFEPTVNRTDFSCFYVFCGGFGKFTQKGDKDLASGVATLQVLHGSTPDSSLTLKRVQLQTTAHVIEASLDGQAVDASIDPHGEVQFSQGVSMKQGSALAIKLSSPCGFKELIEQKMGGVVKPVFLDLGVLGYLGILLLVLGLVLVLTSNTDPCVAYAASTEYTSTRSRLTMDSLFHLMAALPSHGIVGTRKMTAPRSSAFLSVSRSELSPLSSSFSPSSICSSPSDSAVANLEHQRHAFFMDLALEEARHAEQRGEVPIGALVVHRIGIEKGEDKKHGTSGKHDYDCDDDLHHYLASFRILSRAGNRVETCQDASAHAELLALREAAQSLGNWRLVDTTLYTTLEPCPMCLSAAQAFRVSEVVYGAPDIRLGAIQTHMRLLDDHKHPYHTLANVVPGIRADESAGLLRDFFRSRRQGRHEQGQSTARENIHGNDEIKGGILETNNGPATHETRVWLERARKLLRRPRKAWKRVKGRRKNT